MSGEVPGALRRAARLRREYLYRKSLEGAERAAYEQKRALRRCLEEGRPIPTELRAAEAALRREVAAEDDNTAVPRGHADDEYGGAAARDPRVLVTTSRDPSTRLVAFAKELKLLFPGATRVNRGGRVVRDLVAAAAAADYTDVVVAHEHRGEPDGLVVCHLPHGPTAYFGLAHAVLRHDIGDKAEVGTVSEARPRLVLEGFTSPLGARVATILRHLFPAPKPDSKRVVSFVNRDDWVSLRHHTFESPRGGAGGARAVELTERGPRFELKLYQLRLGTMDAAHAENEYVLRAYTRSAKRGRLAAAEGDDSAGAGADAWRAYGMARPGAAAAPDRGKAKKRQKN